MKFGIKAIKSKIPVVVKRIAAVTGAISIALGSYGLITNDQLFVRIGGICTIISAGLPVFFGVEEKKDECSN